MVDKSGGSGGKNYESAGAVDSVRPTGGVARGNGWTLLVAPTAT